MNDSAPFQPSSKSSREAARRIAPRLRSIRRRVYEYIKRHPGVTDAEIRTGLGLNQNTARPRRIELERKGLVEWTGETMKGPLGAVAQCWRVTKLPYPDVWQEGPQVQKTLTGEARIRRALSRAIPRPCDQLAPLLEELITRRVRGQSIRKVVWTIQYVMDDRSFRALMEYVLR